MSSTIENGGVEIVRAIGGHDEHKLHGGSTCLVVQNQFVNQ